MAGMAEQAIQRAVEAYRVRDISFCDLVVRSEVVNQQLRARNRPDGARSAGHGAADGD